MIWKDGDYVQVELWKNFSKRKNSTKIPATTGQTLEVALKDATSIENPTFILSGNEFEYNYIKALGHYYFVQDLRSVRHNVIEVNCEQDVLATYKSEILATNAYVLRSASEFDGEVVDNLYPIVANVTKEVINVDDLITDNEKPEGSFVIGLSGNGTGTLKKGSVSYYAMDTSMMLKLCDTIYSSDFWTRLKTDYENPIENIVSCYWIPYDLSTTNTIVPVFGRFDLDGCTAYPINTNIAYKFAPIEVPKHPLASTKGVYLNQEPFTHYYLTSSAFGVIPINAYKLLNVDNFNILYNIDKITGQGELRISEPITLSIAQVGVPITLSQNTISIAASLNVLSSGTLAVGSAASGNIPGAIAGLTSMVSSAVGVLQGDSSVKGSNGSFLSSINDLKFIAVFNGIADEDNEHHGRPLCKVKTLGSLRGYTLCSDASVNLSGFSGDKDSVNSYLNSGFYIE